MNYDRMDEKLAAFISTVEAASKIGKINRVAQEQVKQEVPLVRKVLDTLEPGLGQFKVGGLTGLIPAKDSALAGRGIIALLREGEDWLQPDTPVLAVGAMHPLIWRGAQVQWESGDRASGIENAYRAVHTLVRTRYERPDLSDDDLFNQAFSPRDRKLPRLWLPGDRGSDDWNSRQRGLHSLAIAMSAGVRNVLAHRNHDEPDIDYQTALETLAAISLLARRIELCRRVEADG